jgi:hypothetical protein
MPGPHCWFSETTSGCVGYEATNLDAPSRRQNATEDDEHFCWLEGLEHVVQWVDI